MLDRGRRSRLLWENPASLESERSFYSVLLLHGDWPVWYKILALHTLRNSLDFFLIIFEGNYWSWNIFRVPKNWKLIVNDFRIRKYKGVCNIRISYWNLQNSHDLSKENILSFVTHVVYTGCWYKLHSQMIWLCSSRVILKILKQLQYNRQRNSSKVIYSTHFEVVQVLLLFLKKSFDYNSCTF